MKDSLILLVGLPRVSERVSFGTKLEGPEIKDSGVPNSCSKNGPKVDQSAVGSPLAPVPKPCPQKPRLTFAPNVRRVHLAGSACRKLAAAAYIYHPHYVLPGRVVHECPVCDSIRSDPLP